MAFWLINRPAPVSWLHSWRQHISVAVADAKATLTGQSNRAFEPENHPKAGNVWKSGPNNDHEQRGARTSGATELSHGRPAVERGHQHRLWMRYVPAETSARALAWQARSTSASAADFAPWRGVFYPDKLTQAKELACAASKLTSIWHILQFLTLSIATITTAKPFIYRHFFDIVSS